MNKKINHHWFGFKSMESNLSNSFLREYGWHCYYCPVEYPEKTAKKGYDHHYCVILTKELALKWLLECSEEDYDMLFKKLSDVFKKGL